MKYVVVRSTEDPVVRQYLDTIFEAVKTNNAAVMNAPYKQKHSKNDVLVVDTVLVAAHYLLRGYKNIVLWMQGIVPEESFLRNKSRLRYAVLSWLEYISLRRARAVFLVSEEMKKHYEEKYHINLSSKAFIMPCFNEKRVCVEAFTSKEEQKQTFVYIGSLSEWQCFEETVMVYALIEKEKGAKVSFTVLTRDTDRARSILEKHGVKNYTVDFVKAEEVVSRIAGTKYGFVLRKNIAVNRVATPTKLSNYLAAGIIPIYSSCLGGFHQMNQRAGVGVPCDIDNLDEAASTIMASMDQPFSQDEYKNKCERVFSTYYCYDKYVKEISAFLRKIRWHE